MNKNHISFLSFIFRGRNFLKFLPCAVLCALAVSTFADKASSRNVDLNNPKEVFYEREESKVRKAIFGYQNAVAAYMKEKGVKSLAGLTDNNCANIKKYFVNIQIKNQNGCNITEKNGVYWHFNNDGSAKIYNSKRNSIFNADVGVCDDGSINCKSKYPSVGIYLYSR